MSNNQITLGWESNASATEHLPLDVGAVLLRSFAQNNALQLLDGIESMASVAPFRHMMTPGGFTMSVAMTNCGSFGWVTDQKGYRYAACDPVTGMRWPPMPELFRETAREAAAAAGFHDFMPDACLINRYAPGARMSLHQDKDEEDFAQPIVSVSLGLPATFLWGGQRRADRPRRVPVVHGDIVVWGGPTRKNYHGVSALKQGSHPLAGELRYDLTFRRALRVAPQPS